MIEPRPLASESEALPLGHHASLNTNGMPLSTIMETSPYKLHLAYSKNGRDLGLVLNTKKTVNFSIKLHVVAIY